MKNFIEILLKYWLYNQWFFVVCIAACIFSHFIGNTAILKFHRHYNVHDSALIYYLFYILQFICVIIAAYHPVKKYWEPTIKNYDGSFKILVTAAIIPFILATFTFVFYFIFTPTLSFTPFLLLSAFIHISILIYCFNYIFYLDNFILIFFMVNFAALAYFGYFVYLFRTNKHLLFDTKNQ